MSARTFTPKEQARYGAWIKTRPPEVRALAAEFPAGTEITAHGKTLFVIGWDESDNVILSPVWPGDSEHAYDKAMQLKEYSHAECLRNNCQQRH